MVEGDAGGAGGDQEAAVVAEAAEDEEVLPSFIAVRYLEKGSSFRTR